MTAARLTGCVLLAAAGAMLGYGRTAARKRQLALLRSLDAGLGLMADELLVLRTPLPQIFVRLRREPFFRLLHAGFGAEPTDRLWRRAAETLELPERARAALISLAPTVGRYDAQRQAAAVMMARRQLENCADALETELAGRARSYAGLGASLGAMLAVLLF